MGRRTVSPAHLSPCSVHITHEQWSQATSHPSLSSSIPPLFYPSHPSIPPPLLLQSDGMFQFPCVPMVTTTVPLKTSKLSATGDSSFRRPRW